MRLPRIETLLVLAAALTLLLVVTGASLALVRPMPWHSSMLPSVNLPWWAVAMGFAATESVVLHIQLRREAQTVSLSEFPLVLGLFFATPLDLLIGRVVGSAAVFILHRRQSALKTTFNVALVTSESVVALTVFHLVFAQVSSGSPVTWLGAYGGV